MLFPILDGYRVAFANLSTIEHELTSLLLVYLHRSWLAVFALVSASLSFVYNLTMRPLRPVFALCARVCAAVWSLIAAPLSLLHARSRQLANWLNGLRTQLVQWADVLGARVFEQVCGSVCVALSVRLCLIRVVVLCSWHRYRPLLTAFAQTSPLKQRCSLALSLSSTRNYRNSCHS